jgi:hypothetical protein
MPYKNKEIHNNYCKAYYHNHKEEIKEKTKERYERRKEQISYYKKMRYWRNKLYILLNLSLTAITTKEAIEGLTLAELKHECKKVKDAYK